jgi:hypothetical protein
MLLMPKTIDLLAFRDTFYQKSADFWSNFATHPRAGNFIKLFQNNVGDTAQVFSMQFRFFFFFKSISSEILKYLRRVVRV